jgi:trimethylamine--corrinoid protein Co-methyltransferase
LKKMNDLYGGQYRPLTEGDVQRLHEGALTVLEKAGVQVYTDTGFDCFRRAGAVVDEAARVVRLPRAMVEDALAAAPHRLVLCGREEKHDVVLEGSRVSLGTGGTALYVLDLETGQRRPSTNQDVRLNARLTDALENVHLFTINVFPNEITHVGDVDVNRFYSSLTNTSKHVMGGVYSLEGTRQVVEMATLIAGSLEALQARPFISFINLVISPLKIDDLQGEITCYVAEQGLPQVVPTEPICGTTSPVTLAANVMMHVAESLAGVALTQVVRKGAPVIFGSVGSVADMHSLGHLSGAVERGLINAAVAQMAQYYRLPYYSTSGTTDAKVVDAQAAYESALMTLLVMMAGANYIHDAAGLMEFDLTVAYEKLVMDNEIIGMCARVLRGIEVTDETLAVDLICEHGAGRDYLGEMHTVQHMRREFFYPRLADRQHRDHWEEKGSQDATTRARSLARRLLATHEPLPLPLEVDQAIRQRFPNIKL